MAEMTRLLLLLLAGVSVSSAASLEKRIIGGVDCKDNERLYHVQLVDVNGNFFCGGSLIHKDWVLTAAHCWEEGMKAVLGVHPGPGTTEKITAHEIHPDYRRDSVDIMLLKLAASIKISPVPLPTCGKEDKLKTTQYVQIAGHADSTRKQGEKKVDGYTPSLQCVMMHLTECPRGTQNHLCYQSAKKDTCPGDSGGGVVYEGKIYGVHVLGGLKVCSASAKCTDVCSYKKWIEDTIKK